MSDKNPFTAGDLRTFPAFAAASDEVITELLDRSLYKRVPGGMMTSVQGSQCHFFPVVLDGSARVFITGESGREITLYRLTPGTSCVLSASCILSDLPLPAYSVAEGEGYGAILAVPPPVFREWFDRHGFWRHFVVSMLATHLANVISVTNATAFRRLDVRVAEYLLAQDPGDELRVTHQDIAAELGSSREVISRVLKSFEVEGLIHLGRGVIRPVDPEGLVKKSQLS